MIKLVELLQFKPSVYLMSEHAIKRLPVINHQGVFKGMISRETLLKEGFSAMKSLDKTCKWF